MVKNFPESGPEGPLFRFRAAVAAGAITADSDQERAAEVLQALTDTMRDYRPQDARSWWSWLSHAHPSPPTGVYLWGGVGRGKSMLMDLFFESSAFVVKRRVHFHAFMLEVHHRLHELRAGGEVPADDALIRLAGALAGEARLLCFDEFHVTDIADAMILGRLFTSLFAAGVVMVATSNWHPDELYKDGLQRALFLPFIELLKSRVTVINLLGPVDYRFNRLDDRSLYHTPLGVGATEGMERLFARLTDGAIGGAITLTVEGRRMVVPLAARGVAWFDFEDLCARPRGVADYLAIAARFRAVLLDGVPIMGEAERNEARRLITLVDALYEHGTKLVVAAAAPVDQLYRGQTHAFEFDRTISRLMEMRSLAYLHAPHRP